MAPHTMNEEQEEHKELGNGPATSTYTADEIIGFANRYAVAGLPPHPVVVTEAKGSHLWDENGNKYLDLLASYSSVNQGHCHPRIV